jgi:hypothetical protein
MFQNYIFYEAVDPFVKKSILSEASSANTQEVSSLLWHYCINGGGWGWPRMLAKAG